MRNLKILGKKVYASFGFHSMMKNKPLVNLLLDLYLFFFSLLKFCIVDLFLAGRRHQI